FHLLRLRGLRRFQIGFVWRLFQLLVFLSMNVRIRLCQRPAAVACHAATQAHPVLVIRPASAIRHPPLATRYPPLFRRHPLDTRCSVSGSGGPIPRQSGPPDPAWAKLVCVPASGTANPPMSRPRRPKIGFVLHKETRIHPTLTL